MTVTRGQLKSLSRAVERAAKAVEQEADNLPDAIPGNDEAVLDVADANLAARLDRVKGLYLELERAMTALEEGTGRATPAAAGMSESRESPRDGIPAAGSSERLGFSEFLTEVGGAMMASQRALDAESLRYLAESRQSPHVQPSVFRIPKLSAEMKFALEKSASQGVNLIFFQNQSVAKEMHQQSISFELVAVPPPPDALSRGPELPAELILVTGQTERENVIAAGTGVPGGLPDDADPAAIVLLAHREGGGHLVLYAAEGAASSLGIWVSAAGVFRPVYPFAERPDGAEAFLRQLVQSLAARQQPFLEQS